MATRGQPSTVRLRRLAGTLRALRQEAALTRDDAAEKTGLNPVTLWRIETAKVRPHRRNLLALLDLYGVTDEQHRTTLIELCNEAHQLDWLQQYEADLSQRYLAYIGFESEAYSVRNFEPTFVPGLLQTEAYARALIGGVSPFTGEGDVEHRIRVRMQRQTVLHKEVPLQLWTILDEAVLHRLIGGEEVMRAQLAALIEATRLPHVTVQVIPFSSGAHPGMPGSFALMSFPEATDSDLVYTDSMASDSILEREREVRRFSLLFQHLQACALNLADSAALIKNRIDALT